MSLTVTGKELNAQLGHIPVVKGNFSQLPKKVQRFVTHYAHLFAPRGVYICDGSAEEAEFITQKLIQIGTLTKLRKYKNSYLCCTDPSDVARVEAKTFICTANKFEAVPHVQDGVQGILGKWMSPEMSRKEIDKRFPNCMKGRLMFVIPFCMGPLNSPLRKIGIQVTDSSYVVLSMRIMTRVSPKVLEVLGNDTFVKCVHSVGCPCPVKGQIKDLWPCNPKRLIVLHYPKDRVIKSYGSGYGGNSLLGKKCFALRIASVMARDEGWLAEHMMIMSITTPQNREFFVAAAFPSACGKTNMAMMTPGLPGYKVRCIGDDIAWLKFDEDGVLRAINPEAGFFGVAPGTNMKTNPNAMLTFHDNSIFTNVGETEEGGVFWEGLEKEVPKDTNIRTWRGQQWSIGAPGKAAHPNSRFTVAASQCPIIHPKWEDPNGVPISAIVFGGRRPQGVPLVYQARSWAHGVMIGACVKSESTAAAEYTGKKIMHDPMAMRPFFGYNFGQYLQHWLDMEKPGRQMPKIFHVNWFRLDEDGKFLWPGFGENIRVLDWILRRCDGDQIISEESLLGYLPRKGCMNMTGLGPIDEESLYSVPAQYWLDDTRENLRFLQSQVGCDTPAIIKSLLLDQEQAFHEAVNSTQSTHQPCCCSTQRSRCYVAFKKPSETLYASCVQK